MADSNELIVVQFLTPAVVFQEPGGVDAIIERVKKEIELFQPDVSTPVGREAIKSFAFKITKTKTGLEAMGKDLVRDQKLAIKKIDEERGRLWDMMEELQKLARKPLDEFEAKEAARIAGHEHKLREIAEAATFDVDEPAAAMIAARIEIVEGWRGDGRDWQEFAARADLAFADTMRSLNSKLVTQKQRETERAELEELRRAEAERQAKERDEKIAEEAAETARLAAEKIAKDAADEAERVAEIERKRLQDIADAKAAELVAANERAAQAVRDAAASAQRATEAAAQAVRDEQARVAAQKKIGDDAAAARAKDAANRKAKNDKVAAALLEVLPRGTPTYRADLIIEAIADGKIPHVTISY